MSCDIDMQVSYERDQAVIHNRLSVSEFMELRHSIIAINGDSSNELGRYISFATTTPFFSISLIVLVLSPLSSFNNNDIYQ